MTTGRVAYWNLDETSGTTAADSSGNGNTGTVFCTDSGCSPDWTPGKVNGALGFDGVNDYVSAASSSSLNITGGITLSAWINPSSTSGQHEIICKKTDSNTSGYTLRIRDGALEFRWGNGTSAFIVIADAQTVDTGAWQHVAVTYDLSTVRLYLNGIEVKHQSQSSSSIGTNTNPVRLGSYPTTGTYMFYGAIDEAKIFNRALQPWEIKSIAGIPIYGNAWNGDNLSNVPLSGSSSLYGQGQWYGIRFRSATGQQIDRITYFNIDMTAAECLIIRGQMCEYGAGTGGTINVSLYYDDGTTDHLPDFGRGQIAGHSIVHPINDGCYPDPKISCPGGVYRSEFRTAIFDGGAVTLTQGELYHIVFQNVDTASHSVNYSSVDNIDFVEGASMAQRQPGVSDIDLASIIDDGTNLYNPKNNLTPIFALHYGNTSSSIQGQGYENIETSTGNEKIYGSNIHLREQFVPSASGPVIAKAYVWIKKVGSPGTLYLNIIGPSGINWTCSITSTLVSTNAGWVGCTFVNTVTLNASSQYYLRIYTDGGDTSNYYQTYATEQGTNNGLVSPNLFTQGWGQRSTDAGSTWTNLTGGSSGSDDLRDLMFYFK